MATVTIPNRPAGTAVRSIAQILANFDAITNFVSGANLDQDNLTASLMNKLGVSSTGTIRRGKVINGADTITSTSFAAAPTPDIVSNVVCPANGLILVGFRVLMKAVTTLNVGGIGLYIGGALMRDGDDFDISLINGGASTTIYEPLVSNPTVSGSISNLGTGAGGTPDGASGRFQFMRGFLPIWWSAGGTADVELRYKVTSASVNIAARKLYVYTVDF